MFALLMIFLWIPIVQKEFGIFHVRPLKGVLIETPKPQLTLETYASGEFQKDCEGYVSENFGLREPVIRLYNQYAWSLFHKNFNVYFVPGKKNWIFYLPAVRDYYGQEQPRKFETKEKAIDFIDNEVDLMCTLRDSLKHYNVEFLSYMSPDKVFIYPEYMPTAHWKHDTTTLNGSEYFSEKLEEAGFPNIDMTKWFIQMKDTIDYQLFKRMNFHWEFSAAFAYDSLFRMMSDLNGLNIPKIKISCFISKIPHYSDKRMSVCNAIVVTNLKCCLSAIRLSGLLTSSCLNKNLSNTKRFGITIQQVSTDLNWNDMI